MVLKSEFKSLINRSFEVYRGKENFGLEIRVLLESKTKDCFYLKEKVTEFRSFSGKFLNL